MHPFRFAVQASGASDGRSWRELAGPVPALVETLQRRREEYGFNYIVIHDHEVDAFAPVVAALAGS